MLKKEFTRNYNMDFFTRVKQEAKKSTGYSLQEFIISIGLNHDSYYSLKRMGNLPRADEVLKIAKALGTTVEYLLEGPNPKKNESILLDLYCKLDETGKKAAIGSIKGLLTVFPQ